MGIRHHICPGRTDHQQLELAFALDETEQTRIAAATIDLLRFIHSLLFGSRRETWRGLTEPWPSVRFGYKSSDAILTHNPIMRRLRLHAPPRRCSKALLRHGPSLSQFWRIAFRSTMDSAIVREKRIKKWNRAWKLELIEARNPEWCDLAEDFGFPALD